MKNHSLSSGDSPATTSINPTSQRKRFKGNFSCPICKGADDDDRGQGTRCHGYMTASTILCAREEHANGKAPFVISSGLYKHSAKGACPCGVEHSPSEKKKGTLDRVYSYVDLDGSVLHETVRFRDPKGFAQRRPNGKGGFVWSLKGVKTILYRRPELVAADPALTVLIAEGEKSVDKLSLLGQIATCSPMGAGKWRRHYADDLRGRTVVILPDNDDPGRQHAKDVALSLQGKAVSIKVVELPGLLDKCDVSDFLASGGTIDQIVKLIAETPEWKPKGEDELPEIIVSHLEWKINDDAIAALVVDPDLYQRNLKLVTVACDEKPTNTGGIRRLEGTPLIRPVFAPRLREDLTRVARWRRLKESKGGETEIVPAHPPDWTVAAILAREKWPNIRYLAGIVETPTLRYDGSVIETPGFDQETGLLYVPNGPFPPVPSKPSQKDAMVAAKILTDLVGDFPFKTDSHKAAWLAALLTVVVRFLIDGPTPIFLFEANTSGAGKTLLSDLISMIAFGRPMTRTGYAHDAIEMDKQITSTALAGDRVVLFDNLENGGRFGNSALDRATTARTYRGRVLGKLEMTPDLDLVCVFFASGNNTVVVSDIARRIILSRLESLVERPEERSDFKIKDVLAYTKIHRGEFVQAALTILRAFIRAGKPDQGLKPMDFLAWSSLIRNAVKWATDLDPCEGREELKDSNPERSQAGALVDAWFDLQTEMSKKGFTTAQVLRELQADSEKKTFPALRDALADLWSRTKPGELPSSGTLGMKIQAIRGQVFGDKRFVVIAEHKRAKVWGVEIVGESSESSESYSQPPAEKSDNVNKHENNGCHQFGSRDCHKTHQTHQTHQRINVHHLIPDPGFDYTREDS
jgi:hypothetical protein